MITLALISGPVLADIAPLGNTSIESFSKAKKIHLRRHLQQPKRSENFLLRLAIFG